MWSFQALLWTFLAGRLPSMAKEQPSIFPTNTFLDAPELNAKIYTHFQTLPNDAGCCRTRFNGFKNTNPATE